MALICIHRLILAVDLSAPDGGLEGGAEPVHYLFWGNCLIDYIFNIYTRSVLF